MSLKVLVVDDKQVMRDSVAATLQRAGYAVIAAPDGKAALRLIERHQPAAVVTDLRMPEMDGLGLLDAIRAQDLQLPVVLMTAYGGVTDAVAAIQRGAFDFIQKPFEGDQLVAVVKRATDQRQRRVATARRDTAVAEQDERMPALIGGSAAMQHVVAQLRQIASSAGTVLIQGESGTGKEVIARALHAASPRHERIMLCLNCAALSASLLESELFGHEKGAFTGADQQRKGRFELADAGTLLLDEISEVNPSLQAKLLRVLQEGQFERVGASTPIRVDVRVIATTNRDLTRSVADGSFRQDLYYRLNVLPIVLPPLRDRLDDVPLLAEHFLQSAAERDGSQTKRFNDAALERLTQHRWPGNVRELQNIAERAHVLSPTQAIEADLIDAWLTPRQVVITPPRAVSMQHSQTQDHALATLGSAPLQAPSSYEVTTERAWQSTPVTLHNDIQPVTLQPAVRPLEQIEREQILHALDHFDGNRTRTAEALGIGLRTLGLKLKKWKEMNLVAADV